MIKKRLMAVVTVKDGWAVQSFGYRRYLPLGRPEILVENLDRWGADEILLQCIDRSPASAGPDLALLERIGRLGLSTPLIYAGGIRRVEDGRAAVQAAADRICVDSLLHDDLDIVRGLGEQLGAQALVAALPLERQPGGLRWLDYRTRTSAPIAPAVLELLAERVISEAMLIDWRHEGHPASFDLSLITGFPLDGVPLIAFGGLSEPAQLREALALTRTVAVGIGNFLAYREHAVQHYKQQLAGIALRPATYGGSLAA